MTIINSRNLTKTVLLTTIALITISLTTAAPADLFLYPEESSTQINSFTSYELEIENTGNVEDVYTLSSSEPGEITIAPTRIPEEGNLAPGETFTANIWFNPNAERAEGRHSFTLTARSRATGNTYSTTGVVNVIRDYQVNLETTQVSQTVCKGDTATYEIDVTNTGLQPDEVKITTNQGELSQDRLQLGQGETQTVNLEISSEEETTQDIQVRAESTKVTYASDVQDLEFTAETCFDSQINVEPESQDIAAYTQGEYTVNVENLGTRPDTFTLSTDKGQLQDTEIEVPALETTQTTLTYTPTELGTETITINSEGQSQSQSTATAEVYNGMNVETSFQTQNYAACEDETVTMNAEVTNTGEATDTYTLETNQNQFSEETRQQLLPTTEVELEPNQTEELELTANAEWYEEDHTEEIELTATSQTFEETSHTSSTNLEIENCWDLEMNVIPEVQSAGENRSTVYEIRLNNPGTRENTYTLDYEGPEWISIQPREVTVQPGQTRTTYMYAGAPFEKQGEVRITAKAQGTQVERNQTVQLHIGDEVMEEIESPVDRISGSFRQAPTQVVNAIREAETITKALISAIIALLLAVGILFKETR